MAAHRAVESLVTSGRILAGFSEVPSWADAQALSAQVERLREAEDLLREALSAAGSLPETERSQYLEAAQRVRSLAAGVKVLIDAGCAQITPRLNRTLVVRGGYTPEGEPERSMNGTMTLEG